MMLQQAGSVFTDGLLCEYFPEHGYVYMCIYGSLCFTSKFLVSCLKLILVIHCGGCYRGEEGIWRNREGSGIAANDVKFPANQ